MRPYAEAVAPAPLAARVRLFVRLREAQRRAELCEDVRRAFTSRRKELPPRWFYDSRGAELFEEITRLPEYYLTRRERAILLARAGDVASLARPASLVELGAGTSEKTRILLDALPG